MNKFLTKIATFSVGLAMAIGVGVAVGNTSVQKASAAEESYTSASIVSSSYKAYSSNDAVVTFGGGDSFLGTSSGQFANCNLSNYSKYAVADVASTTDTAVAFVLKVEKSNVYQMTFSSSAGTNGDKGNIYAIYSSDNTTFSKITLGAGSDDHGTKLANSKTVTFKFSSCTGYFGVVLKSTLASGNWKYNATLTLTYTSGTPATGISLASTNFTPVENVITIDLNSANNSDTLTPTITPNEATDKSVSWSSNNTSVATVSNGAVSITTSAEGEATITATANGGLNVTATITYRVVDNRILTNVSKDADPTKKTGYVDGDVLDISGMVVYASWDGVKDTSTNLASSVVWANNGVLTENQTEIVGYIPKDTNESYPITVSGLNVAAPSYINSYNIKGNYLIKHIKNSTTYYLKSNGDSSAPSAVTDKNTATVFSFKLVANDTFEIKDGTNYLYCTNTNNGLRIGEASTGKQWKVTSPGTKTNGTYDFQNTTHTGRYISLYATQDFRVYDADAGNRTENTDLEAVKSIKSFDVVAGAGAQTRFLKGNPFNYSTAGYTAQITYDDDTIEDVSASATWTLDTSTVGINKTLTVTYSKAGNNYSDTVNGLEVYVVIAAKLSIDASSATTTFVKDATLDTTGLVINGLDSLDAVVIENISTSRCTFSPTTLSNVGKQTITVSFTNDDDTVATGTYDVTVENNSVTALSWTKRPGFNNSQSNYSNIYANETTLGDLFAANGSDGAGLFTPTWKYAKEDTPSFGTGEHQVHIGLYDVASPTEEGEALTSSHVFTIDENNKYVVAFYEGKASTQNKQLSVVKWRSVIGDATISELFDYSSGETTPSQSGDIPSATIATGNYTTSSSEGGIRLGSGSNTGKLTVTSSTYLISRIEASVKVYGSDSSSIKIGDDSTNITESLTSSYVSYGVDFATPVSSAYITTIANSKRAYVESVTIYSAQKNVQIGKTNDCLNLEKFIDTYLRSDLAYNPDPTLPVNNTTECETLYPLARDAFNGTSGEYKLNDHQRLLFSTNSAYANELARLEAWATHAGESLNSTTHILGASNNIGSIGFVASESSAATTIIIVISLVSVTAIGGYFFMRKRKEIK